MFIPSPILYEEISCELSEGANSSYVTACRHGTRHVRTWFYKTTKQSMRLMLTIKTSLKKSLAQNIQNKYFIVFLHWKCSMICEIHLQLCIKTVLLHLFWASPPSHRIRCFGGRPRAHGGLGHGWSIVIQPSLEFCRYLHVIFDPYIG